MGRIYQAEFEHLVGWIETGLRAGQTLGQAVSFSLNEQNLRGDPVGQAIVVTALLKLVLGRSDTALSDDLLAYFVTEYCGHDVVTAAATEIEDDADRQAFLRDVEDIRASLGAP